MSFAPIAKGRLFYEEHGTAGEPVVLVMGYGMRGEAWSLLVERLSPQHRVVTLDNRGAGRTEAPPGCYTMELLASDLLALVDHLGWREFHLVGISMGGMISQEFALRYRARLRSLTLIATSPGGRCGALPSRQGMLAFLRAQLSRRHRRLEAIEQLLFPQAYLDSCDRKWLRELLARDFGHPPGPAQRFSQLAAVFRHRTEDRLPHLADLPTLIVRPGMDLLIPPAHNDRLHQAIPGSRMLRLDDAGHGVLRQYPDALHHALTAHFRRSAEGSLD